MAKARSRTMRLTWRAGSGPVRSLGPFLPDRACLRPATLALPCPAKPFPADRSTRAHPQRRTERPRPHDPAQKAGMGTTWPLSGPRQGCRTPIPGQTWGHLSHKCRLIHSGGRPAVFVPGGAIAAALPHPHGCRQGKCLVAQRKIPVVHSCDQALLLRLCFYKDIQGRTRNNLGRVAPEPRPADRGPSTPRRGPEGLPHAVHAQGWAWKGCRRAFRRKAVGGGAAQACRGLVRPLGRHVGTGGNVRPVRAGDACTPAARQRGESFWTRKSSRAVSGSGRLKK